MGCPAMEPGPTPMCRTMFKLGYAYSIIPGPMIDGRPTIEYMFLKEHGTGLANADVALLQDRKGKIHILWRHKAWLLDAPPIEGMEITETFYSWTYSKNPDKIRIAGKHQISLATRDKPKLIRSTPLDSEYYCFNKKIIKFERCH